MDFQDLQKQLEVHNKEIDFKKNELVRLLDERVSGIKTDLINLRNSGVLFKDGQGNFESDHEIYIGQLDYYNQRVEFTYNVDHGLFNKKGTQVNVTSIEIVDGGAFVEVMDVLDINKLCKDYIDSLKMKDMFLDTLYNRYANN